ncbi:hypothetical protein BJ742DRAFT_783713 [Cladochytrium replicatum]|nr:hypothetical protein BJ742DRAFT_783713 [Cladochytrium replicatum]
MNKWWPELGTDSRARRFTSGSSIAARYIRRRSLCSVADRARTHSQQEIMEGLPNPWKATITRGSEYLMSADKPYNRGFRLIMDTITIPIEPTTATITTKYAFKFRKVEYKWRMASFSDAIATITTSNGPYRPHSKAIGTNGTIILQQMPTKNVCAIYMRSTGVIDFASEAFDDAELRDVIIGSLFPVIEFGRASSL